MPATVAVPAWLHVPSKTPLASDAVCGKETVKRSRNTSDDTPVSATFVSWSSFAPSCKSDGGRLRPIRHGCFPANRASPRGVPLSDTLTWWSTGFPDSDAPCRKTSSRAT